MIRNLLTAPFQHILDAQKEMRRSQFEALPSAPGGILFLGDSITEQGAWNEWFPDRRTINRGIGGDTVAGVAARLTTAIHQPEIISLLIGTNDLGAAGKASRSDVIADQMEQLVVRIRSFAPVAPLIVNSVMPRTTRYADRIRDLNERYHRIAAQAGAEYLDLWPVLSDQQGGLRTEYTSDNLHLRGAGYQAWVEVLRPRIEESLRSRKRTEQVD